MDLVVDSLLNKDAESNSKSGFTTLGLDHLLMMDSPSLGRDPAGTAAAAVVRLGRLVALALDDELLLEVTTDS